MQLLYKEHYTINELAGNFDMSRSAVSKHIKVLYSAGFITIEDIGRERYCTLSKEGFSNLQEWINEFDEFWKSKLKKLEVVLNSRAKKK